MELLNNLTTLITQTRYEPGLSIERIANVFKTIFDKAELEIFIKELKITMNTLEKMGIKSPTEKITLKDLGFEEDFECRKMEAQDALKEIEQDTIDVGDIDHIDTRFIPDDLQNYKDQCIDHLNNKPF